jgi:hypothetical protein
MTLTKTVGELLKRPVDTACNLIEALLGEPFQIAGSALADKVAYWQWENRVKIADKTQRILAERRITTRVLPPDFLLPFIRDCGDTSDETLQDAWARLLTAAIEDDANQHIAFVRVLSGISATDAKVLQAIIEICPGFTDDGRLDRGKRLADLEMHLGLPVAAINMSMCNLYRMGFFHPVGKRLSGFAVRLLRICLTSSDELDHYLEKEDTLEKFILQG